MLIALSKLLRWALRQFVWFAVIVVILLAGIPLQEQVGKFRNERLLLEQMDSVQAGLPERLTEFVQGTNASYTALRQQALNKNVELLAQQIEGLKSTVAAKAAERDELSSPLNHLNPEKQVARVMVTAELEASRQGLNYAEMIYRNAKERVDNETKVQHTAEQCEALRQTHERLYNAYQTSAVNVDVQQRYVDSIGLIDSYGAPLASSSPRELLAARKNEHATALTENNNASLDYKRCLASLDAVKATLNTIGSPPAYTLAITRIDSEHADLRRETDELRAKVDGHWVKRYIYEPVVTVLPTAVAILASVMLVPLFLKFALYFALAPLVASRRPICFQPHATPPAETEALPSSVSVKVSIAPDEELLVTSAFFHSASDSSKVSSKLFLDWRYPLSSLASGLYSLTAVGTESESLVELSSGNEALDELSILTVREGESICLRPRNLVGVIHPKATRVRVTRHWRLGTLQAWLSLQLRYFVFHGPSKLIVRGCRGVHLAPAEGGRAVEKQVVLGFSSNLNYSSSRTETFLSYLQGDKGLLRDHFSGQGYYVYESMPHPTRRSGILGRGLEGVSDALLKVVGL